MILACIAKRKGLSLEAEVSTLSTGICSVCEETFLSIPNCDNPLLGRTSVEHSCNDSRCLREIFKTGTTHLNGYHHAHYVL